MSSESDTSVNIINITDIISDENWKYLRVEPYPRFYRYCKRKHEILKHFLRKKN